MQVAGFGNRRPWQRIVTAAVLMGLVAGAVTRGSDNGTGVLRSRAYKFNHITSAYARDVLSQLRIGSGYDALTETVLIVTSSSGEALTRAMEVITVLDQPEPVSVRVLGVRAAATPLPEPTVLADRLTGVSAGTMTDAPPKGLPNRAIIDMLDNQLIAIGTEPVLGQIEASLAAWVKENPVVAPAPEPVEPVEPATAATVEADTAQDTDTAPDAETDTETETETDSDPDAGRLVPLTPVEAETSPAAAEPEPAVEELTELVEPVETPEPAEPAAPERSLAEIAAELMGRPDTTPAAVEDMAVEDTDAVEPTVAARPSPAVTMTEDLAIESTPVEADAAGDDGDDFLNAGLLATLEAEAAAKAAQLVAEQAAARQATVEAAAETADAAGETETMTAAARERASAIAAMQAQARAEQQAARVTEVTADDELKKALAALLGPAPDEAEAAEAAEPAVPAVSSLERELAMLREQIAELKAAQGKPLTAAEAQAADEDAATAQAADAADDSGDASSLTEFEAAIGEEMLETVIDLPQEVELESLVDLVGKQLGLNYMYDPAVLRNQKVTLKIHKGQIKVRDLYTLLETVLRSKDLVMTRGTNNLVEIFNKAALPKADPVFRGPQDPIQPGDILVSTVYDLQHIAVADAVKTLNDLKMSTAGVGSIQPVSGSNMVIVTDYAYRMPRITDALAMIDVAGEPKEFEYRQLRYMQAGELVEKLKTLIAEMEGVSLEVSTPAAPVQTRTIRTRDPQTGRTITKEVPINAPAGGAAAAAATQEGGVFIDIDARTNRILMIGKSGELDTLNRLIDTLDVPQQDLKYVREYVIQYVQAMDVVNVLNELALASVSVSAPTTTTSAAAAAARDPQAKPPAPAPRPTAASAASGGEGTQPSISIRPATNSLLVNATAQQHEAIELVIAHVDVVQKDQRTIREYEIQYVDTQEIIDTMTDLGMISTKSASGSAGSRSTTSGRGSARSAQPEAAEMAAPATLAGIGGEEASSITEQEPQISILEATNSLLVYATPRQHQAVALLIAHADRTPESTTTPYVVYALENQDPLKLAETLDQIVSAREGAGARKSSAESKVQAKTPDTSGAGANIPSLEEETIRIIPDEDSYSLVVYANKRNQQWISELIKELDEYRPQVLLDCTLVEVTQNEKFEYDLDIISKTYGASDLRSGTGDGAIIGQQQSFVADRFADARMTTTGDPVLKAFFNSQHVQGLLTAIQSKGYGRIMARPKILVNDNQEGEIKTENQTSIAQQSSKTIPGTGGSDPIITEDVTFGEYSSGITLLIKPHISKGDMLRLEIQLNRKDFDFSRGTEVSVADKKYPRPPDLLSTDVTTVATVPDGTTIILGGLETIKQSKGNSKIPLLGDLPIVGGLFRGVNDSGEQGKLYVFVKANIIRPGDQIGGVEDIKRVSGKYRTEFEAMEEKFQGLQDWPGIDPEPMDPVKVLDADFEEN